MKLTLEREKDISILVASGAITGENLAVIKAGLKKLFRDGKNRIILELPDSKDFPTEVLRELAVMNLTAAELSGQIVLVGIEPLTRARIHSFSSPPAIVCYMTRAEAVAHFYPPITPEIPNKAPETPTPAPTAKPAEAPKAGTPAPAAAATPAASGTPAPTTGAPGAPPAAAPAAADPNQYKDAIRNREMAEVGELRKKIIQLQAENTEYKTQLAALVISRRSPPNEQAYQDQIGNVQKQLEDLLAQVNAKDAKKP